MHIRFIVWNRICIKSIYHESYERGTHVRFLMRGLEGSNKKRDLKLWIFIATICALIWERKPKAHAKTPGCQLRIYVLSPCIEPRQLMQKHKIADSKFFALIAHAKIPSCQFQIFAKTWSCRSSGLPTLVFACFAKVWKWQHQISASPVSIKTNAALTWPKT